ncbi:endonuclease/exonuclease/phosphatase family protein [Paenibacillus sp. GYB003]|uniref:endonuclease/exonuclease/phosphatase family protein n=1 Tax=Paenibacillus sp. GYB003 TaxID=2994392 RepID=UPI002F965FFB
MTTKHAWASLFLIAIPVIAFSGCSSEQANHADNAALRVMTFNLRTAATIDRFAWEKRRPAVRELLMQEKPDLIGTQEGTYAQLANMADDLPAYRWIGEGRDGERRGEFSAIFYNKERMKPLQQGNFWLSGTPDVPGSKTWGNTYPRMATWALFQDLRTRKKVYAINTHLDHQSELARQKGAELIIQTANTFEPGIPILLTGDFNSKQGGYSYEIFVNKGSMKDAFADAEVRVREELGTMHHFTDPTGGGKDNKIDWILYRGHVNVLRSEVVTFGANRIYPSDHYPVLADILLLDRQK